MKTLPSYTTPEEAETAFYRAFEQMDLQAMMGVWAADDSIVCIHPMGAALRGRKEVEASWRTIFRGSTAMRFELSDVQHTTEGQVAIRSLHENIRYGPQLTRQAQVIATNVYKLTGNGWRMMVHHASPGADEDAGESPADTLH